MSPRDSDTKAHVSKFRDAHGFRHLTKEERQQFVNALDDEGRQLLAEVAGEATNSMAPRQPALCLTVPYEVVGGL
jgi:hypothetical protein